MSIASERKPTTARFISLRVGPWLAVAFGLGLAGWTLHSYGVAHVVSLLVRTGWLGATLIVLFHLLQMACSAYGWRAILEQRSETPGRGRFLLLRWVREAVNNMLPFTQIGGEVVAVRLLGKTGLRLSTGIAATTIDLGIEVATQIVFTLAGLMLLVTSVGPSAFSAWFGKLLLLTCVVFAAGLLTVRLGAVSHIERLLLKWTRRWGWTVDLEGLHTAISTLVASPRRMSIASAWHLLSWLLGGLEVCLILHFFGHDLSLTQGLIVESIGQASKALGFAVPAALGVQEVGYLLVAKLIGLPAELGLALSLVKRVREVIWGSCGLYLWHRLEWSGSAAPARRLGSNLLSRVAGTSWTHLLARPLVRPLIGTWVRPNHLTTLRVLTGVVACLEFARGGSSNLVWGGLWWVVSAFLDRADGELARLGNMRSVQGHRYDYISDVAVNTLFFVAIGIGLRDSWLGSWAIPLGLLSGFAIWMTGLFAEWLEQRSPPGTKAYAGRWGFDPDDALYLMGPFAWLGWLAPVLLGASVGATTFMLITGWRVLRARRGGLSTDSTGRAC
ncbi:MAG: flippase-like domain-containing protein [Sinobacteraceae bacterium]|nr:flippase-like domain-containing protein [Nevskiaceae bacterium]